MDEDAELGVKIPLRDLIILERFPVWFKRSFWESKLKNHKYFPPLKGFLKLYQKFGFIYA